MFPFELTTYFWICLGFALLGIELFITGFFFLWPGVTAVLVGIINSLLPLTQANQLILFAILTPFITVLGRRLYGQKEEQPNNTLNQRGKNLIGQIFTLDRPMINGHGRLIIADSSWTIEGPDLKAGTKVRIKDVRGNTLVVDVHKE